MRWILLLFVLTASSALAGDVHTAAAVGDVARLQELLQSDPTLIDSTDEAGATPLHWAADRGQIAAVELLLSLGANVNAAKKDGVRPLHVAAAFGRAKISELLISAGADANAKDNRGRTPLSIAQSKGHKALAEMLLSRGAVPAKPAATLPAVPEEEAASRSGRPVVLAQGVVRGIPVNVIYVNMNDPGVRVTAAIAQCGIGGGETFSSFMRRLQPTAAVNGTFFSKADWRPIGDIVIDGRLVHFGGMGTGLCVGPANEVAFVDVPWGRHTDWSGYQTVVCSGPRLIRNGNIEVNPRGQGFRDPHVVGRARRTAIGLTHINRIVLVSTRTACSLTELAQVMKELGCVEGVNLDGGASAAMYYRGKMISKPGRQLTNVLLVYQDGKRQAAETELR